VMVADVSKWMNDAVHRFGGVDGTQGRSLI
jgi:hypothetical protein